MRILKIRLKNINSLRGEQEVPFDESPLKDAGLFGIVGATGSGKSTLLDCITLALFGSVPRLGPVTKSKIAEDGIILTKNEKDCYAEVVYECKEGKFTAKWSISKTKTGSLREAEMKVFNETGELISNSLRDAPLVNKANIGLDYEEFLKSILLCQGDFAQFLLSKRNQRADLLEKITGTHEFRRLGKKAFKVYTRHKTALENKQMMIGQMADKLLDDGRRTELQNELGSLADRTKAMTSALDEAKDKLRKKVRLKALDDKLDEQRKRKTDAEQKLNDFESAHGAALKDYDKLFIHKDKLSEYARLLTSLQDASGRIAGYVLRIGEHDAAIKKMVMELREWVGEEVSEVDYIELLRSFRDKVRDALQEYQAKKIALTACLARLEPLLDMVSFQQEKALFSRHSGNVQLLSWLRSRKKSEADAHRTRITTEGLDEDRLYDNRVSVDRMVQNLGQLKLEVRSYTEKTNMVGLASQRISELEARLKEFDLESLRAARDAAKTAYEQAKWERDQLLAAERLEELRKTLKDGEPCPLCGSAHHPYLHGFAEDAIRKSDTLARTQQEYERCRDACSSSEDQVGQITSNLHRERQLQQILEQEKQNIKGQVEKLKRELVIDRVQSEDKVQEQIDIQRKRLTDIDECIRYKEWEPKALQLERMVEEYDGLFAEMNGLKDQLSKLYRGSDIDGDCGRRERAVKDLQDSKQEDTVKLRSAEEQQIKDRDSVATLQEQLEKALALLGYPGIAEAKQRLISETEQKSLLDQKTSITQEINGSGEQLQLLVSQREEEAMGNDALSVEQQQLVVDETTAGLRELDQLFKDQSVLLQSDDNLRTQMGEQQSERKMLQDALRPWEMLNELIGDAKGNNFNTMAQEITLEHLLILANHRLKSLHSRYSLLTPKDVEDHDLRVSDAFMGGEVRTVRSLSGGETFVLSLALALGLSDLASRDIRIDSLFVDEGFGSLDPETLDEAMSTLEQLQSESNKMVGIISHVESLKDRIFTQIRLTKGNSGFSTLSIYPEADPRDESE